MKKGKLIKISLLALTLGSAALLGNGCQNEVSSFISSVMTGTTSTSSHVTTSSATTSTTTSSVTTSSPAA